MVVRKSISGEASTDSAVEFRSPADDAWYSVKLFLVGETLIVSYYDMAIENDHVFDVKETDSLRKVEEFGARFRPVSVQLQDSDCRTVVKGTLVCASHDFESDECVYFADAVVIDVERKEHSFVKGEEECLCTFKLLWQHGPNAGLVMTKTVENITVVQSNAQMNPVVASFLKIAREKIENLSHDFSPVSRGVATYNGTTLLEMPKSASLQHFNCQDTKLKKQSPNSPQFQGKDDDSCGKIGNNYSLLVENLETEVSASTIAEFVHKHTSISLEVYVIPTFSSEPHSRGVITLDCQKDYIKLCDFLDTPKHIVVSSRGRPWVITKRMSGHDTFSTMTGKFIHKHYIRTDHKSVNITDELKIVHPGTEEHKTATQLQVLFTEFTAHLEKLHESLTFEERSIMKLSRRM